MSGFANSIPPKNDFLTNLGNFSANSCAKNRCESASSNSTYSGKIFCLFFRFNSSAFKVFKRSFNAISRKIAQSCDSKAVPRISTFKISRSRNTFATLSNFGFCHSLNSDSPAENCTALKSSSVPTKPAII